VSLNIWDFPNTKRCMYMCNIFNFNLKLLWFFRLFRDSGVIYVQQHKTHLSGPAFFYLEEDEVKLFQGYRRFVRRKLYLNMLIQINISENLIFWHFLGPMALKLTYFSFPLVVANFQTLPAKTCKKINTRYNPKMHSFQILIQLIFSWTRHAMIIIPVNKFLQMRW